MTINFSTLLSECGLDQLSDEDKKDLLAHIQVSLESRVGELLYMRLSPSQRREIQIFTDDANSEAALALLQKSIPDYQKIVDKQWGLLKRELRARRSEILDVVGLVET